MIVEVERARPVPSRRTGGAAAPQRIREVREVCAEDAVAAPVARRRYPRVRSLAAGLAAAGVLLSTGCDSVSGIPADDQGSEQAPATQSAESAHPDMPVDPQQSAAPELPPVPADAPVVGAVPGVEQATPALQRFAADLRAGDTATLQQRCWSLPPLTVQTMYADPGAVLSALAQPGTATDGNLTWTDGVTTVTVTESRVESGYACGRVSPAYTEPVFDAADARHTVRRYLARSTGQPLDPTDREERYPLVCAAQPAGWDPQATGAPVVPPLAGDSGALTGITGFADQQISSQQLTPGYMSVSVPVTNAAGITQNRTFLLEQGDDGYCIGEISS
ncbi:hypothetical protein [Nocardia sp. NPDC024068]|uniref:hypothetical protein n=1 Tax=Nocardia sp. NPDC024068 TaxID=3157197 RepID=UPI0033FDD228